MTLGLAGCLSLLLVPRPASADEPLEWARIDFLRNRVQLVPRQQRARRARIADVLSTGDALRTARSSRAELRFSDGSLARIGERATFRFTPNTRNFQLTNGTVLLLIPPERGRSTIQTPNAVTGIQGSALFVRYIPETDTTIVGALTNNPDGPMVLFNRDGTEQQALRANEIGVIQGDQITQLYQFDGELFWQSSGLAEGFNYLNDSSSTGSDALDAVRQEIREAIADQRPLDGEGVIENPGSFSRPLADEAPVTPVEPSVGEDPNIDSEFDDGFLDGEVEEETPLEFKDSPAAEYLNSANVESEDRNSLEPAVGSGALDGEDPAAASPDGSEDVLVDEEVEDEDVVTQAESETLIQDDKPAVVPVGEGEEAVDAADAIDDSDTPAVVASPATAGDPNAAPTAIMDSEDEVDNAEDEVDNAVVDTDGLDGEATGDGPDTNDSTVDGVDVDPDASPGTDAPESGDSPGESTGQPVENIPGDAASGSDDSTPGDAAVDPSGGTDGLILLEEESGPPAENEVVPLAIPNEGEASGPNDSADVEGLSPDDTQQELVEITIPPESEGVAGEVPPVNDMTEEPPVNEVIEVPSNVPDNVPDNDAMGADVPEPVMSPVEEVTTPLDSIETPAGGLSGEPLPEELNVTDVPLVAPMDEMMNGSMTESTDGSMGNGMGDMTDTPDAMGGGTPDAGNSAPPMGGDIPGTVPVPSTNTPPDNAPPENAPPENGSQTPDGSETPSSAPEAPRGTV